MRGVRTPEATIDQAATLYASGLSSYDIGVRLGLESRVVRKRLQCRGVIRERADAVRLAVTNGKIIASDMRVDPAFFQTWTPALGWVLGLIAGDGHVRDDARTQTYQISMLGTEQVTRAAAKLLGHTRGPLPHHQGVKCWEFKFSSREIVKGLVERFGWCGNKAAKLRVPASLPTGILPHFIRGLWDADGTWRVRGNHIEAGYITASQGLRDDLARMLGGRARTHRTRIEGYNREYTGYILRLRATETRNFARWIYHPSSEGIRCGRKYGRAAPLLAGVQFL